MIRLAAILTMLLVLTGRALQFSWNQPPDYTPTGYVLFHGTNSGQYYELWNAGTSTNFNAPLPLPLGNNYFVCTAFAVSSNGFEMSGWSNEVCVTNVATLDLSTVILTSTNLMTWTPWQTNHLMLTPTNALQFFKTGSLKLSRTNQILLPPMPQ